MNLVIAKIWYKSDDEQSYGVAAGPKGGKFTTKSGFVTLMTIPKKGEGLKVGDELPQEAIEDED